ncbi:MAG TPA: DNA polymerase III subunit delta [Candidatus Binatia bacterium]
MKPTLDSILAEVRKGNPPSLLLLHGDEFQVRAAAGSLVDLLVPEENRAFNLERFDGRAAPWDQIEAALMTAPFFPGLKAVWVEEAPYFASAENKSEMGEKVLRLWGEGKKDEAARLFFELLSLEGWTQEKWDRLDPRAAAAEAGKLLDADKEAEALAAHARAQNLALGQGRGEADRLMDLLERGLPPWGALLLTAAHVDRRTRLYKKFADKGAALDLGIEREKTGKLDRRALAEFLDRRLVEAGKRIEPRAREAMLARAGTELWSFHQELEKLLLYVGEKSPIQANEVEEIVLDQGEGWVFDLTDALIARNALSALAQVARLMAQGSHPLALLGPITSSVRRLLIARQFMDDEARRTRNSRITPDDVVRGMPDDVVRLLSNPRAAYKCVTNAQSFTAKKLTRDLDLLYQTDIRLKSSGHSPRIVMERLIFDLCRK